MDIVFLLVVFLQFLTVGYIGYCLRKGQEAAAACNSEEARRLYKKKSYMRQSVQIMVFTTLIVLILNHTKINTLFCVMAALTVLVSICVAYQGRKMGDRALTSSMFRAVLALIVMIIAACFFT